MRKADTSVLPYLRSKRIHVEHNSAVKVEAENQRLHLQKRAEDLERVIW